MCRKTAKDTTQLKLFESHQELELKAKKKKEKHSAQQNKFTV